MRAKWYKVLLRAIFFDEFNATDVARAYQSHVTLNDVNDSKAVNVPIPPEVIAASNVSPTLTNAPTPADVIALQTHSDIHNKTYSGEWGQAKVVDGNTSEPVVMMRGISTNALLNPPDDVLKETFDT